MKRQDPRSFVTIAAVCALASACAPATDDLCAQAARHVASCNGAMPDMDGLRCSASAAAEAQGVLSKTCSELRPSGGSEPGKEDFWTGDGSIAKAACLLMVGARDGGLGALCCFDRNCRGDAVGQSNVCRDYRCRVASEVGGPCKRRGHCQSGLACVAKTCQTPRARGEACPTGHGDCASGLICGPAGTCSDRLADGETCTDNAQCALRSTCIAGQCAPRGSAGARCDDGDASDCDHGLTCIDGSCASRPASGGACDRSVTFQCPFGETCWQGRCEARHPLGGACENLHDCDEGFCRGGVCTDIFGS
ncbi:MAG: hypothetical protein KC503_12400 [Myxococcales bacterium]|nr:hypothetical protein [Myxococcales bacterium]